MSSTHTQWSLDPSHTSVEFAVRHMGLATVRGRFRTVSGIVTVDEQDRLVALDARIDAASIDTGDAKRDAHLRSPDFLHAEQSPALTFTSREVQQVGDGRYRVLGDLTIRDQTRPVTLDVEATAPVVDPWGLRRAAASATVRINRKDWELTWNQVLEFGALLVGEDVRITIDAEAVTPAAVRVA